MEILVCSIILVCLGYVLGVIVPIKEKCKHDWVLIDSGDITNKDRFGYTIIRGFIKVYECEKCKKMRKEEVRL